MDDYSISDEAIDAIVQTNPGAKLWGHLDAGIMARVEARRTALASLARIPLPGSLPPPMYDPRTKPAQGPR